VANSGNNKIKLLILLELLNRYSDEEHPLSSGELCALLEERGVTCERKSIYRDIAVLTEYGVDIIQTRLPKPGFFVAKRDFELPEVRLLLDAVLTAPFITNKKTAELTGKLRELLSCYQAESVFKQIYVDQRVKFENEEIYYNIDAINRAISSGKQISFLYYHRIIVDQKAVLDKGREFQISPYALLWANDKYYLAGNYNKYDTVSNFRLDRMKHASVTAVDSRSFREVSPYREYFDTADYLRKTFNMYNGEQELVELRCANDILEAVVDKFGSEIEFCCHDENAFTVRAHVCVSNGLIEWLLQYGSRITVQSPIRLRQEIISQINGLNTVYQINQETHDR